MFSFPPLPRPSTTLYFTIDISSGAGRKCKCTHRDLHCFCFGLDCDLLLFAQRMWQGPSLCHRAHFCIHLYIHIHLHTHSQLSCAVITLISAQYIQHHKVPKRRLRVTHRPVLFLISRDVIAQYFNYIFIWHLRAESAPPPRSFFACPWERWAR